MTDPLAVEVEVVSAHPGAARFESHELTSLAASVLAAEGAAGAWSVTVALVDDEALRQLHERFMGVGTVTDVMTFPHQTEPYHPVPLGGDIVISLDRAEEQGAEHGFTAVAETRFLFVHGLLHLVGWEDGTPNQRQQMLRRQALLLQAYDERCRDGGRGRTGRDG